MKLEGAFLFDAPVEEVWRALFDPVVLAAAMPGCERLDRVGEQYQGDLNIKVGPIQGKFGGKVDLKDIDDLKSYTMLVEGRGAPGFVKATAAVRLEREGEGTRLHYVADAQVGGKIASVGQRLLEASARAISKQSLEGVNENVKIRAAAAKAARDPPPPPAPADTASEAAKTDAARPQAPSNAPLVVRMQVTQNALAAGIAKEVTRTLLPRPVLIAVAIGVAVVVGWFVVRH